MFGIGIGALALIVVLSAFNGIQELVESLYSKFDADIRIEAEKGKTFSISSFPVEKIKNLEEVKYFNRSLEETVLLKYEDNQTFATIKGVDQAFMDMSGMDSLIWSGGSSIETEDGRQFILLGLLVADKLGAAIHNVFTPINIYAAKVTKNNSVQLENAFYIESIFPSGVFAINPEFDAKYTVAPYSFVEKLLHKEGQVTAVELALKSGIDGNKAKEKIKSILGPDFSVKTRYELNEILYKTNNSEKWATFLILAFILVIVTFNVIGSLTILILDKKNDVFVLRSMGATIKTIRQIFFAEGMMISIIGGICGIALGVVLVLLQTYFGLIKTEGLLVDHYPVKLRLMDILYVIGLILSIGGIAAWLPAKFVTKRFA